MTAQAGLWPRGLVTALVTPLSNDDVDLGRFGDLVEQQIRDGVAGLVVGGGTGEFSVLTLDERERVAAEAVRVAANRIPVIVQTGALATNDSIRLSKSAAESGAAGLLVASPFGEPINWRERLTFYEQVNAAVEVPIMVYNTPAAGLLAFGQIQELAELSNVSAVKDSSGDAILIGDLLTWAAESANDFFVYVGLDSLIADALTAGAPGALLGVGNFLAPELVPLIKQLQDGHATPGRDERWHAMRRLLRFMENSENYVALVKEGCALRRFDVGPVRAPFLMPTRDEAAAFAVLLSEIEEVFTLAVTN